MPDMLGGFNPAMLSQMDPASLAQLQKMAAQVRPAWFLLNAPPGQWMAAEERQQHLQQ